MIRTYEFLLHGHSISDTEFYYFNFFDTLENLTCHTLHTAICSYLLTNEYYSVKLL